VKSVQTGWIGISFKKVGRPPTTAKRQGDTAETCPLAETEEGFLTADETQAPRKRHNINKRKAVSLFSVDPRQQAEAEGVTQDPDEEKKCPSVMSFTVEEAKMQTRREQKCSSTIRRTAMQSDQHREPLQEMNTEHQNIR
jgi:hypothetical protein